MRISSMALVLVGLIYHVVHIHICNAYTPWTPIPVTGDVGTRLILTPYIESGNISEAKDLSRVNHVLFEDISSYSGFLTVNSTYNSNLFFWFFPAEQDYENAPLLLWLQGGPGGSGMLGVFKEIGPFLIKENLTLVRNPYSWHTNHSLLFVDNPVGTGFSFTDNKDGYAKDLDQIRNELYNALIQFLTLFSELQQVDLFVAGESYGGKYVPALAYTIHEKRDTATLTVNLKGIVIGNGFIDPISCFYLSDHVYHLGLLDTKEYEALKFLEELGRTAITEEKYLKAAYIRLETLQYLKAHAKLSYFYDFSKESWPEFMGNYATFVQMTEVRKALHVGDAEFSNFTKVIQILLPDMMKSARPLLDAILDQYEVLHYSGQRDIAVAYPLSVRMFNTLQFSAAEEYRNSTRVPWYVDGELAGYMKSGGNFTEVLVRNAGHMVPMDQPKWALDLVTRFTHKSLVKP